MKNILLVYALLFISSFGIAQNSTFEINLKSGKFTPEVTVNFQTAIKPQMEERRQGYIYRLVQFYSIPTNADKQRIAEAGIDLLSYISNKAFISKIENGISATALEGLNIRSLLAVKSQFKLSPQLAKTELPEWAIKGNSIKLNIKYFSKKDKELLIEDIISKNGEVIFLLEENNAMTIRYNADEIAALANHPLIQWIEPISKPGTPEDTFSQNTMRVNSLKANYFGGRNYDGAGVVVGLSDDGIIGPHIDSKGRVVLRTEESTGSHADLTSGIFIGAGNLDPSRGGVASGADIHIFGHIPDGSIGSHTQIVTGVENLEAFNLVITSTSWSQGEGGVYTVSSEFGDQQVYENQNMMHVFSGGNQGDRDHEYGAGPGWANITGGYKAGKNIICVGNINPSGDLAFSSGRGPAWDGRIKPDICAQGDGTWTTDKNNTYQLGGGTSAAAPAVAGAFTQLYQAYKELNEGVEPETGLIKAAILNTATDRGNPGPDFEFGWGEINGLKAVRILEENRYIRDEIGQTEEKTHTITIPENVSEARIMTYWTGPGGNPVSGIGLVNDIDMQVVTPSAVTHSPLVLDPTPNPINLAADAVEGIDRLNNVEQVRVSNPQAGDYTVNLSGFAIPEGPQVYFVVYEFIYEAVELTYPIGREGFVPGETETIRWDASEGTENFELSYSTDGGTSYTMITNSIASNAVGFNWLVPNELSGDVKLKLTRGGQEDETDQTFTIVPVPQNIDVIHICTDSIGLEWNAIPGVSMYEVSLLGEKYMDSIGVTSTNSFNVLGLNPNEEHWFSVRSVVSEGKGRRAIAINQQPGNENCNLSNDMAVTEILNNFVDFTPCTDTEEIIISTLITNLGIDPQSDFEISYQLNNGAIVTEIFSETLMPGEQVNYDFTTPLVIPETNSYTLFITVILADDQNTLNDMASLDFFGTGGNGAVLDFEEDFENGITPAGWLIINDDEELTWEEFNGVIGSNGSQTTAAFFNNFDYDKEGEEDFLITEYFDLTETSGEAVLNFDLAKAQFDATLQDGLRLEISIDCGLSFTTIYQKEGLELSTLPNFNTTPNWEPNSPNDWRTEEIDLTAYLGESVLFRIVNVNGFGSQTYIDNINLSQTLVNVEETIISNIKIFPNPASETINIDLGDESAVAASAEIMNSLGQLIATEALRRNSNTLIDVSKYTPGLYFITVKFNGLIETKKIFVE